MLEGSVVHSASTLFLFLLEAMLSFMVTAVAIMEAVIPFMAPALSFTEGTLTIMAAQAQALSKLTASGLGRADAKSFKLWQVSRLSIFSVLNAIAHVLTGRYTGL